MFVTSAEQRAGVLVAVISGGRPTLKERPTHKLLDDLHAAGFTNIVWVVAEHDADGYERDDYEMAVYPSQWSYEYAASHWMSTDPVPGPGGFHGAFTGREWACLEAERRGCWAVLQLDDNVESLQFVKGVRASWEIPRRHGQLAMHADLFAGVALSTNGRMVGAQLNSIPEPEINVARPGFCYSVFLERVGEGREHWYGPFEDDITHAYQYGTRADGATPVIMPMLLYTKEFKAKTGMRTKYNHKRAVQLQRIFPESAKINIRRSKSNGAGGARVFHTMLPTAIRNPLTIHNVDLYNKVTQRLTDLLTEWGHLNLKYNREKIMGRIEKAGITTEGTDG